MQLFHPLKLVDLELSNPVQSVENLGQYFAVKALVRMHGTPVGYTELGVTNGRCSSRELCKESLEKHSWAIMQRLLYDGLAQSPLPEGMTLSDLTQIKPPVWKNSFPSVTVAVCTRDRVEDLRRCLSALCQIDYTPLEILVVDNAPATEDTLRLVKNEFKHVKYVRESRPGLSWARNRAIAEAQSEIIAFTDDDVQVDVGWVEAFTQVFAENSGIMAVTGLVVPLELETKSQILFELHGGQGRGFHRKWLNFSSETSRKNGKYHGTGELGCGANMAFRRKLFEQIGDFDVSLGAGTVTEGGEDLDMFFRVLHEGYSLVYEPGSVVFHRHRRDYSDLRKQIKANGIGLAAYHFRSALSYQEHWFSFFKLHVWWLMKWHAGRLILSLTRPCHFPRELILKELWGYLIGPFRYLKARRHAAQIRRQFAEQAKLHPKTNGKVLPNENKAGNGKHIGISR